MAYGPTQITVREAAEMLRAAALRWEGVTVRPHRLGGIQFRLGRRELGHLHGSELLDIPFPMHVRNELVAAGDVLPHHVLPSSGWISFRMATPADVEKALLLLRRSYEIASRSAAQKAASAS